MSTADTPAAGVTTAEAAGAAERQPLVGVLGLIIVGLIFYLLFTLPGPESAPLVLGPISTFWLPVLAVTAIWWGLWPAQNLGRPLSGVANTIIFVGAAIILTYIGMLIVGPTDFGGMFTAGSGNTTFPWTIPLAAAVFVTMLQLTFVSGKWPLHRMSSVSSGWAALALSWAIAIVAYFLFVDWSGVAPAEVLDAVGVRNPGGWWDALDFVGLLIAIVIWQVVFFILYDGWPFSEIKSEGSRLLAAHLTSVLGGLMTYVVMHDVIGMSIPQISAAGGTVTAAVLVSAMLWETWPFQGAPPGTARFGLALNVGVLTLIAYFGLRRLGEAIETFEAAPVELWVAVGGLNFIAAMVILHYAVWGRWPLAAPAPPPEQ